MTYDCPRCKAACDVDPGCQPTEFCHHCAQTILAEATTLEEYEGTDGRRQWADRASVWLYPGDRLVVINVTPPNG